VALHSAAPMDRLRVAVEVYSAFQVNPGRETHAKFTRRLIRRHSEPATSRIVIEAVPFTELML